MNDGKRVLRSTKEDLVWTAVVEHPKDDTYNPESKFESELHNS